MIWRGGTCRPDDITMIFRALAPNPVNTKLITLMALAGVVLITYSCLFAGVMLKMRGDLPGSGLLWFLKNYGALLYIIPILFLITSRAVSLIEETGGVVEGWRKSVSQIFGVCGALLFLLPGMVIMATMQGTMLVPVESRPVSPPPATRSVSLSE